MVAGNCPRASGESARMIPHPRGPSILLEVILHFVTLWDKINIRSVVHALPSVIHEDQSIPRRHRFPPRTILQRTVVRDWGGGHNGGMHVTAEECQQENPQVRGRLHGCISNHANLLRLLREANATPNNPREQVPGSGIGPGP